MSNATKINIFSLCVIVVSTAQCMGACDPEKTTAQLRADCNDEVMGGYHDGPNCRELMSRYRTYPK